jgi:hypothetical protein
MLFICPIPECNGEVEEKEEVKAGDICRYFQFHCKKCNWSGPIVSEAVFLKYKEAQERLIKEVL